MEVLGKKGFWLAARLEGFLGQLAGHWQKSLLEWMGQKSPALVPFGALAPGSPEGGEYMNNYNNVNKSCSREFGLHMTFPKTWDETIYPCSWWGSGSSWSFFPLFLPIFRGLEADGTRLHLHGQKGPRAHQGFSWHSSLGQSGMRLWASICSWTMHGKHCQMPQVFSLVNEHLCCQSSWDL